MSKFTRYSVITLIIPLLILVLAFFNGCDKDPVSSQADYRYPLSIGNSWTYSSSYQSFARQPDSLIIAFDTIRSTATVSVLSTSDSLGVPGGFLLETFMEQLLDQYVDSVIFLQDESGLKISDPSGRVAGWFFMPYKSAENKKVKFAGREFSDMRMLFDWAQGYAIDSKLDNSNSLSSDSMVLSLKYPLKYQTKWDYRTDPEPFTIKKEVLGRKAVSVPAGSYFCYEIQWQYDMNNDSFIDTNIVIHDYIGTPGLVLRVITIHNIAYTNEGGTAAGQFSLTETIELTSYDLK